MTRKTSFITMISMLLMVGFSAISFVSYYVANDSLNQHIRSNTLPLTSDNIYSEIQRDLLQPILVSSLMARDTFVHDWVKGGEKSTEAIVRYLKNIQDSYNTVTAFFVSDTSQKYYHSTGVLKRVEKSNAADAWYFNVSRLANDFEINLDVDTADNSRTTFFVNHKVINEQGEYLGAIGVGLASQTAKELIDMYQHRYGRRVYFVDRIGQIRLQGESLEGIETIHQVVGLRDVATQILSTTGGSYSYQSKGKTTLLKTRFMPDLNWYLLVEQTQETSDEVKSTLWINLLMSFLITLIIMGLAHLTLGGYQRRLEAMATTDLLTGTSSRHAFEASFNQLINFAKRRQQALSVVLVDIDHFKQVNDRYGHLQGDQVLVNVAKLLRVHLRSSDVICRWGGEEFLLVLPECDQASAMKLANKIRELIELSLKEVGGHEMNISASFGVAQFNGHEAPDSLFHRADQALYLAKELGRNRVEPSPDST